MSYEIKTLEVFEKKVRKLIRKYPSLKDELTSLVSNLKENLNWEFQLAIPVLR